MCNQGSMRLSTRYRLVPAPSKEISRSSRSLRLRSQFLCVPVPSKEISPVPTYSK